MWHGCYGECWQWLHVTRWQDVVTWMLQWVLMRQWLPVTRWQDVVTCMLQWVLTVIGREREEMAALRLSDGVCQCCNCQPDLPACGRYPVLQLFLWPSPPSIISFSLSRALSSLTIVCGGQQSLLLLSSALIAGVREQAAVSSPGALLSKSFWLLAHKRQK